MELRGKWAKVANQDRQNGKAEVPGRRGHERAEERRIGGGRRVEDRLLETDGGAAPAVPRAPITPAA